ncbi:LysR family transcriptional regulator [Herbaspirillum lusitanum]|uniref:LysR family transcriptional regulator n=1 Tax=Herbaspirillum lusitanum TaxID=213312 RepID=UPI0003612372|nr:LysR family transcriptional regulator [Herbaspirillum lusitanum]
MNNLDLKLLRIFIEIHKTQSISQAAINLDLGQPTVSMALAKLREHFDDPLFARTSQGMQPTPLAEEIVGPMRLAFTTLTSTLQHRTRFDPATSDRMFGLCMTDVGQRVVMPQLLAYCKKHAPLVRFDLSYVSEGTVRDLESGAVDLALGYLAGIDAGFYQQALFTERFVCLVSSDHPRITGKRLTLRDFEEEAHIVVATEGTAHNVVDKMLTEQHIKRKIGLRIPNYLGVVSSVIDTDFLAIVPEKFGEIVSDNNPVRLLPLPLKLEDYRVMQHWHGRFANDLGIKWLRQTMMKLFGRNL